MIFTAVIETMKAVGLVLVGVGLIMNASEKIRERKNGRKRDGGKKI